jgi:hypothetical protein
MAMSHSPLDYALFENFLRMRIWIVDGPLKHTQVLLVPSNLIAFKPNLTDLEPFCCRGVELIAGGVTTIRQVEHQWSYVMRPLKFPS